MSTTAVQDIEEIQTFLRTIFPNIAVDGDVGKATTAAVASLKIPKNAEVVQAIIARKFPIAVDGDIGPKTMAALAQLDAAGDAESLAEKSPVNHPSVVRASFFAGPQDTRAFDSCKEGGGSDTYCFSKGDNGIGARGADCTSRDMHYAALPREVWQELGKVVASEHQPGSLLFVEYKGVRTDGELGDTMPALDNIHNGCGIDLNPGFAVAFGIDPEKMNDFTLENVTWGWL